MHHRVHVHGPQKNKEKTVKTFLASKIRLYLSSHGSKEISFMNLYNRIYCHQFVVFVLTYFVFFSV